MSNSDIRRELLDMYLYSDGDTKAVAKLALQCIQELDAAQDALEPRVIRPQSVMDRAHDIAILRRGKYQPTKEEIQLAEETLPFVWMTYEQLVYEQTGSYPSILHKLKD